MREVSKKKDEEESILNVIKSRGVRLGASHIKGSATLTLQDLEAHHPAAQVKHITAIISHYTFIVGQRTFPTYFTSVWCYCAPSCHGKDSNFISPPGSVSILAPTDPQLPLYYFVHWLLVLHKIWCSQGHFLLSITARITSTILCSLIHDACFLSLPIFLSPFPFMLLALFKSFVRWYFINMFHDITFFKVKEDVSGANSRAFVWTWQTVAAKTFSSSSSLFCSIY